MIRQGKTEMSFDTQALKDRPVILQTCHRDYRSTEIGALWADGRRALDELSEPVFYVIDLGVVKTPASGVPSPESLEFYSAEITFSHPNIREILPVAPNMSTIIEALGLHSVLIGDSMRQYFHTLGEALAYCDQQAVPEGV
jgi:hypothetical protein